MSESTTSPNFIELSADIVSAYVSNNSVPASELPTLLSSIYAALTKTVQTQSQEPQAELTPAVPFKKSVTADAIISLEDGKKFKSLKRHLMTDHGLTPQEYRQKWGLPRDYPMVAPTYAAARSELAKQMGLGQSRRKAAEPEPAPQPKRRGGRPRKQAAE